MNFRLANCTLAVFVFCTIGAFAQLTPCSLTPIPDGGEITELLPCDDISTHMSESSYLVGQHKGSQVSIDGDWAALGIPAGLPSDPHNGIVYLYHFNGSNWVPTFRLQSDIPSFNFGEDVLLEGNRLVVSAPGDGNASGGPWTWTVSDTGQVFIYEYDGLTWNKVFQIKGSQVDAIYDFGHGIEILDKGDDGLGLFAGGYREVYTIHLDTAYNILNTAKIYHPYNLVRGHSIEAWHDWLWVGATDNGALFTYKFDGHAYRPFSKYKTGDLAQVHFDDGTLVYDGDNSVNILEYDSTSLLSSNSVGSTTNFLACGVGGGFSSPSIEATVVVGDTIFAFVNWIRRYKAGYGLIFRWEKGLSPWGAPFWDLVSIYSPPPNFESPFAWQIGRNMDYHNGNLYVSGRLWDSLIMDYKYTSYMIDYSEVCMPPRNTMATSSPGGVTFDWSPASGATGYRLRVKDCNSSWTDLDNVDMGNVVTSDTTAFLALPPDLDYSWDIQTVCGAKRSERALATNFSVPILRNLGLEEEIKLYPNPASNSVLVSLPENEESAAPIITDITGKQLSPPISLVGKNAWLVDVSSLSAGIYLVNVAGASESRSQKLVVR